MAREKYQTRLPGDIADEVDEYIDEREISQAEAVRRLVEAGLEAEDKPEPPADRDGDLERAAQAGTVISVIVIGLLALILVVVLGVI